MFKKKSKLWYVEPWYGDGPWEEKEIEDLNEVNDPASVKINDEWLPISSDRLSGLQKRTTQIDAMNCFLM